MSDIVKMQNEGEQDEQQMSDEVSQHTECREPPTPTPSFQDSQHVVVSIVQYHYDALCTRRMSCFVPGVYILG